MSFTDWSQILIFILAIILISPLMGKYMALVFEGKPTLLTPVIGGLENFCYRSCKIVPTEEMSWKTYLKAVLILNLLGFITLFVILISQKYLPFNPQNFPGVPLDMAFNIAASFTTNTNWQAYNGETTLSYFTQMVGLTTQNFLSPATGMGVLLALIRGFKNKQLDNVGNFWEDLVRAILYIFLPLSLIFGIILVSHGVVQTLMPYEEVITLENAKQIIPLGPAASQIAIKQLGTNGGGFFGVNSAHPFENPTNFTNSLEHLAIILIPMSLIFSFGYLINFPKQGAILFYVVTAFWIVGTGLSGIAISQPYPFLEGGLSMEGIETRIEPPNSVFWMMSATATTSGSTNASISSLTPLASGLALFNIMLGESIMGGVGTGLCALLKFVLFSVFISGLLVGRTPEYLGKKIEKREMLSVIIAIFVPSVMILLASAISFTLPEARSSVSQPGPHGYSEILYAITATVENNGSSLKGLKANTFYYNILLGFMMLTSRLIFMISTMAIAGSVSQKRFYPISQGTLATDSFVFGILLSAIILLAAALTFFPALVLGPIFEHLLMIRGITF